MEIRCLDGARLETAVERLQTALAESGVDLCTPCGNDVDGDRAECWITRRLPALNEVLWTVYMQVTEHNPGAFTLRSLPRCDVDDTRPDSAFLDGAILVCRLLRHHRCIKRLELGDTAVVVGKFPTLLSDAIHQNSGLVETRVGVTSKVWDVPRAHVTVFQALTKIPTGLERVDMSEVVKLDHRTVNCIADAIRRGLIRNLKLQNFMSKRVARGLFSAVAASTQLSSLEFTGSEFPVSSAVLLVKALTKNTTLQKLSIYCLGKGVFNLLFHGLAKFDSLTEWSLGHSPFDLPPRWWNFEALQRNRGLKSLKLVNMRLDDGCAAAIAGFVRANNTLQELRLSWNEIGDRGAGALADALQHNDSLKLLHLSRCPVTADAVSSFVVCLARNATLECVSLGSVQVPEQWTPPVPLTANLCARLYVTWNTRGLQEWCESLRQPCSSISALRVAWTDEASPRGVMEFFSADCPSLCSVTELVVSFSRTSGAECADGIASLLRTTSRLKKLSVCLWRQSTAEQIVRALAENETVGEAEFRFSRLTHKIAEELQVLFGRNRTLHRLHFWNHTLNKGAIRSLALALESNFVLLALDYKYYSAHKDMYPVLNLLNRNRSVLNRAVDCVLTRRDDVESVRALSHLSACDSLVRGVAETAGKSHDESKRLVLNAVHRMERASDVLNRTCVK